MKKVIYGILILIGVAAITSNFIVDSSKLDHKKVSASGTACKWISDTGYGVGPVYYEDGRFFNSIMMFTLENLKIMDCNSTNSGVDRQGGVVYADKEGSNLLTKISVNTSPYVDFENGKIKALKQCVIYNQTEKYCEQYSYEFSSPDVYLMYRPYFNNGIKKDDYLYQHDYVPAIYTCVCAEY